MPKMASRFLRRDGSFSQATKCLAARVVQKAMLDSMMHSAVVIEYHDLDEDTLLLLNGMNLVVNFVVVGGTQGGNSIQAPYWFGRVS